MAKQLKAAQTITNMYGDVWDEAILVVDQIDLNYLAQVINFTVDIYKNDAARTNLSVPQSQEYQIDKVTFLANFDTAESILNLKQQAEDYALLLEENGEVIYDQFE